ncbi:MAG: Uncharacterised protein [Flavobacterium sp. SCGC AAA160-P02]|nr:MAG: Uncharacterised protein [Flavobacterium sp. SCGC AAA160-P02]
MKLYDFFDDNSINCLLKYFFYEKLNYLPLFLLKGMLLE